MIQTKADLQYYLEEDRKAYGKPKPTLKTWLLSLFFPDNNYEFMRNLRRLEYVMNRGGREGCATIIVGAMDACEPRRGLS